MLPALRLPARLGLSRERAAFAPLAHLTGRAHGRRRGLRPLGPGIQDAGLCRLHLGERILPDHFGGDVLRQVHRRAAHRAQEHVGPHHVHQRPGHPPHGHRWPPCARAGQALRDRVEQLPPLAPRAQLRHRRRHLVHRLELQIDDHRHLLHGARCRQQDGHRPDELPALGQARLSPGHLLPPCLPRRGRELPAVPGACREGRRPIALRPLPLTHRCGLHTHRARRQWRRLLRRRRQRRRAAAPCHGRWSADGRAD
mmetsp:Transcript_60881/g.146599  ORF Transcript_60881/g.146599 Transcript_60881/m.146599 type:complete len:255 (+) Transcript_60881:396-1160(+)